MIRAVKQYGKSSYELMMEEVKKTIGEEINQVIEND